MRGTIDFFRGNGCIHFPLLAIIFFSSWCKGPLVVLGFSPFLTPSILTCNNKNRMLFVRPCNKQCRWLVNCLISHIFFMILFMKLFDFILGRVLQNPFIKSEIQSRGIIQKAKKQVEYAASLALSLSSAIGSEPNDFCQPSFQILGDCLLLNFTFQFFYAIMVD